ncbi:VOC family protein [Thermodesulfobacteriota bacterium]
MISRVDHVSIAVKDYQKAVDLFQNILGAIPGYTEVASDLKFLWGIFSLGDLSRIEILNPSEKGGLLDGFLKKKVGGVHHITLETPDINEAKKTLEAHSIPYFGYKEFEEYYWKEIYIHPKDAQGVLIQIAEFDPNDWLDKSVKLPEEKKWSVEKDADGCILTFAHPGGGKVEHELTQAEIKQMIGELSELIDS